MKKKPKIVLAFNPVCTNDPCALCGARCDPCGLDFTLESDEPGRILVCDECAAKHAPEMVQAQRAGLDFLHFQTETEPDADDGAEADRHAEGGAF